MSNKGLQKPLILKNIYIVLRGWLAKTHTMNCDPKSRIRDKTEVKRIEWKAIVGHATKSQYNRKEKQRDKKSLF